MGPITASRALRMDNGHAQFKVALEAVIDAKGVLTSVEHEDTTMPAESSRFSFVQAAREALNTHSRQFIGVIQEA